MKLSVSNIAWSAEHDEEMFDFLAENGFAGLEIAPTRIVPAPAYDNTEKAIDFTEKLKKTYPMEIPSMQSIWFGRTEKIFGTDNEREFLLDYTKKAIDFAAAINCKNLVFGCPSNRRIEDKDEGIAIEFFKSVGKYAQSKKTVFAIEPNPTIYNTDYINTTLQAREVVEKVANEAVRINYDFGTVISNEEKVEEIPLEYVNHIHISEPFLAPIEKRAEHKALAKILSNSDYCGFVSVEMKDCGDIEHLRNVLKYVKDVFS